MAGDEIANLSGICDRIFTTEIYKDAHHAYGRRIVKPEHRPRHSIICSMCGQVMTSMLGYDPEKKFCPYCGAHYIRVEVGYEDAVAHCNSAQKEVVCDECGDVIGWAATKSAFTCEKCVRELHDQIDDLEEDLNV